MKTSGIRHAATLALIVLITAASPACKKEEKPATPAPPVTTEPEITTPEPAPEPVPEPIPEPVEPSLPEKFSSPKQVLDTLAEQLQAGDMEAVKELLGEDALNSPSAFGFDWIFSEGGYQISPDAPVTDIGEIQNVQRMAINIQKKPAPPVEPAPAVEVPATEEPSLPEPDFDQPLFEGDECSPQDDCQEEGETEPLAPETEPAPVAEPAPAITGPDTAKIRFDVARDPKKGYIVTAVKVPAELQALAHAAQGSKAAPLGALEEDALMKAESFLDAVLTQNYEEAVRVCDPEKVPEEKIAALCIVFEEGSYRMKNEKPLMTTAAGDDSSWVIAQVESDKLGTKSDFGLEMTKDEVTKWKITGLNFSKMLSEYAKASDAGKVPYTPIIKNPKGGESLVLYFEYDDAFLVDRAKRQIDIVSRILKSDPSKTLTITGHADALGTDEYNTNLSANRAVSVKGALIAAGVPEKQIVTTGLGESQPLRPNENPDGTDNPKGRGQNRRAEIFLNF